MILKPQKLTKNSTVALIAPSGIIRDGKEEKSEKNLSILNLCSKKILEKRKNLGYLAETDENRLLELENSFENKNIDAIFAIRGGYGATRFLHKINFDIILKNPKLFVGYSDITALQSAFWVKTNLISIHGVLASSEFTEYTVEQIKNLLFASTANYLLPVKSFEVLKHGKTQGRIVGGNLSLLVSLIGTGFLYQFKNNIVFIEEISEPPYKIDRMLTHLLHATDLKDAAAIVFGKFHKCQPENFGMTSSESLTIEQIIKDNFLDLKMPIIFDVNFGHIKNSLIFPIGAMAAIDTKKSEINVIESIVL